MKAAAIFGPGDVRVMDIEKPEPGPGELLVEVKACGLCSSELGMWVDPNFKTDDPIFFGHEVSGNVVAAGAGVSKFAVGDRVTIFTDRGGYAEFVTVPEDWAIKLADHVPYDWALGEPIGCAMNGTSRSGIEVGDTVVLIGIGFMGGLIQQGARLKGASRIIAVDTRPESFELAQKLGADHVIDAREGNAIQRILELTGGEGADVVIEATGKQGALDMATEAVRIRGRLVIFGYHQGGKRTIDVQAWNWKGLDVINAHERDPQAYLKGIRTGMKLLEAGQLDIAPLLSHYFELKDINHAFLLAKSKPDGFLKAVITF
ncbi:threonine dehydrogenase-like Zn-dependent dehydrogenase [Paenibacillus taihuensis]|uniref:Threonine dehydrogenase-like Zn-dependent dehydrogenase n=1 Tax=Paenibacillus taihuensis TaxID=1156355 RepID=A0A3D9S9R1_9BACL|nr:zinc-binding dehydrogenase [Paenibacillus taihuensis]REE86180.1 threonine dehydrogenase-like Zn-dependent dehydrogenase [Paenibacillus taihuensis]